MAYTTHRAVYDMLIRNGVSSPVAYGAIGSLMGESGTGKELNTRAINPGDGADGSDSIGIYQANGKRAQLIHRTAKEMGLPWTDLRVQVASMEKELNSTHKHVLSGLKNASTIEEGTSIWTKKFEVPQHAEREARTRAQNGYFIANKLGDSSVGTGPAPVDNRPAPATNGAKPTATAAAQPAAQPQGILSRVSGGQSQGGLAGSLMSMANGGRPGGLVGQVLNTFSPVQAATAASFRPVEASPQAASFQPLSTQAPAPAPVAPLPQRATSLTPERPALTNPFELPKMQGAPNDANLGVTFGIGQGTGTPTWVDPTVIDRNQYTSRPDLPKPMGMPDPTKDGLFGQGTGAPSNTITAPPIDDATPLVVRGIRPTRQDATPAAPVAPMASMVPLPPQRPSDSDLGPSPLPQRAQGSTPTIWGAAYHGPQSGWINIAQTGQTPDYNAIYRDPNMYAQAPQGGGGLFGGLLGGFV